MNRLESSDKQDTRMIRLPYRYFNKAIFSSSLSITILTFRCSSSIIKSDMKKLNEVFVTFPIE